MKFSLMVIETDKNRVTIVQIDMKKKILNIFEILYLTLINLFRDVII